MWAFSKTKRGGGLGVTPFPQPYFDCTALFRRPGKMRGRRVGVGQVGKSPHNPVFSNDGIPIPFAPNQNPRYNIQAIRNFLPICFGCKLFCTLSVEPI